MTMPTDDEFTELIDADFPIVSLVGKGANGLRFLIAKGHQDDPPLNPTLTSKAGDMTDVAKADVDLDPTEILADPEGDAPGSETDPGSPAWEAVDAATAQKWTAILSRAKNALGTLADREAMEVASGDDEDAENVFDLDDAACAIDYAISVLAPYAVGEQSEAEVGADDMAGITKAATGIDPAAVDTLEGFGAVMKAGRVLSSANESAIRGAVESLQNVLASLPAAPVAKEAPMSETEPDAPEVMPMADEDVTKAKGDPQVAVYNEDGKLIGVVDGKDITPLAAGTPVDDSSSDDAPADAEPTPATEDDLTPAPADAAGTPADGTEPAPAPAPAAPAAPETPVAKSTEDVLKSIVQETVRAALDEQSAANAAVVKALEDRINELAAPAPSKVLANGVIPDGPLPQAHNMRGLGRGATPAGDEMRARLLKAGSVEEQEQIASEMNAAAAEALSALHAQRQ